ncbi:hypothetical protein [Cochleicola gelatinilyticus]|uniref:Uncharacterized protein n=1 Tax=Cochleicola gelatinilyticus TaxID=1763537 RepID=A0A167HIY0_9FLAO|nr:hypothetical protein [Cochleicola gelatinilyticus]OAB78659.1 hypothetical protein ULVI_08735 [Cochleicola gelatinilyticus]
MNLQLNPKASDILISVYVVVTLFFRIKYENEIGVSPLLSLVIGLCLVVMPWVLIKLKILNPNWFGLFKSKTPKP